MLISVGEIFGGMSKRSQACTNSYCILSDARTNHIAIRVSELLEANLHDKINNIEGASLVENRITIGGLQGLFEDVDVDIVGGGVVERQAEDLHFDAVKV